MRRGPSAILALAAALLVLAPGAAALEEADSTTTVTVQPFAGPLPPGESGTTTATVTYCYAQAGTVSTRAPTTVVVKPRLETWDAGVGAAVEPSELHFEVAPAANGATWACAPDAVVNVTVWPWYAFRDEVAVILAAEAFENGDIAASSTEDVLHVSYAREEAPEYGRGVVLALPDEIPTAVQGGRHFSQDGGSLLPLALGLLIGASAGLLVLVRRRGGDDV